MMSVWERSLDVGVLRTLGEFLGDLGTLSTIWVFLKEKCIDALLS